MNVIIIAACIPTLRPIFLVLASRPGVENFRASVRERGHPSYYYRTADGGGSQKTVVGSDTTSKNFEERALKAMSGSTDAMKNKGSVTAGDLIQVESREVRSQDGEIEEERWGHEQGSGVPMTNMWRHGTGENEDQGRLASDSEV